MEEAAKKFMKKKLCVVLSPAGMFLTQVFLLVI